MSADEASYFDAHKRELLERYAGLYALVCGRRLVGIHDSLEDALEAATAALSEGTLEPGATLVISEIAEQVRLRVTVDRSRPGQVRRTGNA